MVLSALAFQAGSGPDVQITPLDPSDGQLAPDNRQWVDASTIMVQSPTVAPNEMPSRTLVRAQSPLRTPRLAIIIDDVADLQTANIVWSNSVPLTVAVLPYAQDAKAIAEAAQGREVFLHLPMEPVGLQDPGLNALTKALPGETLAARVSWALDQVPGAVGLNNHMGSRLTTDAEAMGELFDALEGQQDQLVFVDSLTHPASVAREIAEAAGFNARDRDVFLDHEPERSAVDRQIELALNRAQEVGVAIAIGHPRPQTLAALEELSARAEAAGVQIVTVRELMAD